MRRRTPRPPSVVLPACTYFEPSVIRKKVLLTVAVCYFLESVHHHHSENERKKNVTFLFKYISVDDIICGLSGLPQSDTLKDLFRVSAFGMRKNKQAKSSLFATAVNFRDDGVQKL